MRFDAVYDIAYDWERGTTAQQVEATAKAIPGDLSPLYFHVERGGLWRRSEPRRRRSAGLRYASERLCAQ